MTPRPCKPWAAVVVVCLLLLLLLGGGGVDGGADSFKPIAYTPCKEPGPAAIAVTSVTGDLPARAASTFIVHVGARPERPLHGGRISMEIQARGIKLATRHFNICKDLDLSCPVAAGQDVVAKFRFPVPFYAISMRAEVVITAVDLEGSRLICLEAPGVPVVGWNGAQEDGQGHPQHCQQPPPQPPPQQQQQQQLFEDGEILAEGGFAASSLRRREMAPSGGVEETTRQVFLAL